MMSNQYSMKIYPAGRGREVYRNIEICGSSTLNQLCQVILESFDFIDEHLYEFCMDNRMYSEHAYQSDPEGDEPSADIILDEVGLCKGQKFALHYDFGDIDVWLMQILPISLQIKFSSSLWLPEQFMLIPLHIKIWRES